VNSPIVAKTPVTRFVTDESAWISHVVLCTVRWGETKRPFFFCCTLYGSAAAVEEEHARTAVANAGRRSRRIARIILIFNNKIKKGVAKCRRDPVG
jgi:hypothetical protein